MCDPSTLACQKRVYLADWLNQAKSVQDAVPKVQQQLDLARWEEQTLSDAPNLTSNVIIGDVTSFLQEDLATVQQALPKIPRIDHVMLDISVATTSTTSTTIYHCTDHARHSDDPKVRDWGSRYSKQYENLQDQIGREQQVRSLLYRLSPKLTQEFDDAIYQYRGALAGTSTQPSTGIALRNVIEHCKGEVMNLAHQQRKDEKMTWKLMAERLVDNVGVARDRFQQQEEKWRTLQVRLSKLAKGHIQIDQTEIRSVFTEFLDHLYAVLSLIGMDSR
jgi:hypothetical protein